MKALSVFLSLLLAVLPISGCFASETKGESDIQADSPDELLLSMTESTSKSLAFPLTEEQAAKVEKGLVIHVNPNSLITSKLGK